MSIMSHHYSTRSASWIRPENTGAVRDIGAVRCKGGDEIASVRGPFLDRDRSARQHDEVVRRPPIVAHDELIVHAKEFPAQAAIALIAEQVADSHLPQQWVVARATEIDPAGFDRVHPPAAEHVPARLAFEPADGRFDREPADRAVQPRSGGM